MMPAAARNMIFALYADDGVVGRIGMQTSSNCCSPGDCAVLSGCYAAVGCSDGRGVGVAAGLWAQRLGTDFECGHSVPARYD